MLKYSSFLIFHEPFNSILSDKTSYNMTKVYNINILGDT